MLDLKRIRQNSEELQKTLDARNDPFVIDTLLQQDDMRRRLLAEAEEKKAQRNEIGKRIGIAKKQDPSGNAAAALADEMRRLNSEITLLDEQTAVLSEEIERQLCSLPNYLHPDVLSLSGHAVLAQAGEPRCFDWEPKSCREIGIDLQLCKPFAYAGKQATAYCADGALMERCLVHFLLCAVHQAGFEELSIPLGETGESPLSAAGSVLFAPDVILEAGMLPKRCCACIPLAEENRLTRSLLLGAVCSSEQSERILEETTAALVHTLCSLGLCTRTLLLSPAETEAESSQTIQMEVWLPSAADYTPVLRCSDCSDYLARRSGIRLRETTGGKPKHANTVFAVVQIESLMDALWENHQNDDGSISVPEPLAALMGKSKIR